MDDPNIRPNHDTRKSLLIFIIIIIIVVVTVNLLGSIHTTAGWILVILNAIGKCWLPNNMMECLSLMDFFFGIASSTTINANCRGMFWFVPYGSSLTVSNGDDRSIFHSRSFLLYRKRLSLPIGQDRRLLFSTWFFGPNDDVTITKGGIMMILLLFVIGKALDVGYVSMWIRWSWWWWWLPFGTWRFKTCIGSHSICYSLLGFFFETHTNTHTLFLFVILWFVTDLGCRSPRNKLQRCLWSWEREGYEYI